MMWTTVDDISWFGDNQPGPPTKSCSFLISQHYYSPCLLLLLTASYCLLLPSTVSYYCLPLAASYYCLPPAATPSVGIHTCVCVCVCVVFDFLTRCPRGQQPFSLQSTLTRPQLTGSQTGAPLSSSPVSRPAKNEGKKKKERERCKRNTDERTKEKGQYGRACTNRRTTSPSSHPSKGL